MPDKPLGNRPEPALEDHPDTVFELSDDFDLANYAVPNNLEISAGDAAKGLAVGTLGALEGGAEVVTQTRSSLGSMARQHGVPDALIKAAALTPQGIAASLIGQYGKWYGKAKDHVIGSMTEGGQEALNTLPISERHDGSWKLSTDPAVWGMQISRGVGYLAPTVATAIATGGLSSAQAIPALARLAARSGANPTLASKAADVAYRAMASAPAVAVSVGTDVGAQGKSVADTIRQTDWAQLVSSEAFGQAFQSVDTAPEHQHLSDGEKLNLAREQVANMASTATITDPLTLGTSVAATLIGDVPLANAVLKGAKGAGGLKGAARGIATGAAREAPVEAVQGGAEQYVANKVSNAFGGTDVEPMEGVLLSAANEGSLAGRSGAC